MTKRPPGQLFDLGYGFYSKVKGAIDRSRPGVDQRTPWPALSTEQQGELDQAVAMLREAADQGYMKAQAICADLYSWGDGVAKDDRSALVYYEKAAQQGDAMSQYNAGLSYRDGLGCEKSNERAAEWFEKAALQEHADAMVDLGVLYLQGQGVPQNVERGVELIKRAVLQGDMSAQHNLGAVSYTHLRAHET